MRVVRVITLGAVVAAGLLGSVAAPVAASCAEPVPLVEGFEAAQVVFVGRVVEVFDGDAVVEVREVWKGGDLPEMVVVRGGPNAALPDTTVVYRRFIEYETYVFFPGNAEPPFSDSGCSLTGPLSQAKSIDPFPADGDADPFGSSNSKTGVIVGAVGPAVDAVRSAAGETKRPTGVSPEQWRVDQKSNPLVWVGGAAVILAGVIWERKRGPKRSREGDELRPGSNPRAQDSWWW